jgi:hypothetical protein
MIVKVVLVTSKGTKEDWGLFSSKIINLMPHFSIDSLILQNALKIANSIQENYDNISELTNFFQNMLSSDYEIIVSDGFVSKVHVLKGIVRNHGKNR